MEWSVGRYLLIGGERSLEGVARGGVDGDDVGAGAQRRDVERVVGASDGRRHFHRSRRG